MPLARFCVSLPAAAGWHERLAIYGGAINAIAVDAGGDVYGVVSGGAGAFLTGVATIASLQSAAIAVLTME